MKPEKDQYAELKYCHSGLLHLEKTSKPQISQMKSPLQLRKNYNL